MIIDTHAHTFPDKIAEATVKKLGKISEVEPYTNGTLAGLKDSMEQNGIDCSIVLPVATKPEQAANINKFAAKTNEKFDETGIMSLGGIHPDNSNFKEVLNEVVNLGLKGIKLHPDYQNTDFDDIRYKRIIDYAAALGLVIVVHAGVDIGLVKVNNKVFCTPDMILNVFKDIDYNKMVLAHMGGWKLWNEVEEKIAGRDCYLDTAFCFENQPGVSRISDEQFVRMVRSHGVDKILFATDSPWGSQEEMPDEIRKTGLSDEELKLIFAENARGLFKI